MKKEKRWKHCFTRYQPTGSSSLRVRSGSLRFLSYSPTSAVPTCSASCTSWLPFPSDNDQQRTLLVGSVRLCTARVFAFRKVGLRGKSLTSPQLGSLRLLQSWIGHLRRTVLNRVGAGISTESHLGRSFVSHAGGDSDSNTSSLSCGLAFCSDLNPASSTHKDSLSHNSERATCL
jgi:hypothetical protein